MPAYASTPCIGVSARGLHISGAIRGPLKPSTRCASIHGITTGATQCSPVPKNRGPRDSEIPCSLVPPDATSPVGAGQSTGPYAETSIRCSPVYGARAPTENTSPTSSAVIYRPPQRPAALVRYASQRARPTINTTGCPHRAAFKLERASAGAVCGVAGTTVRRIGP